MVTHDAEEAMHMAGRIYVMRDGVVEQSGTPDRLYLAPGNAFVAGFFGEVNRITVNVREGLAETPLGIFQASDIADGKQADIVIRPEALHLSRAEKEENAMVRVLASRMLGRTSLIHLCTCISSDQEVHLHARMPGRYLPADGDLQTVHLDHSQVFVFPSEEAT
jgi:iron(III) transport system ATP-binding protein